MMSAFLQSFKRAPILLVQLYAQPSKAFDFLAEEKNHPIFYWALLWYGLVSGGIAGVLHFVFYASLVDAVWFAVAVAIAGAVAGGVLVFAFPEAVAVAFAFAGAGAGAVAFAVAGAVVGAVAGAFAVAVVGAVAGAFAFAVAGAVAGAFAVAVAGLFIFGMLGSLLPVASIPILLFAYAGCWLLLALGETRKIELSDTFLFIVFVLVLLFGPVITGAAFKALRPLEAGIIPFSFFIGYFLGGQLDFIGENRKYNRTIKAAKREGLSHKDYSVFQKATLIWMPLLAIACFALSQRQEAHIEANLRVLAAGLLMMPFFGLHCLDYPFAVMAWFRQRRELLMLRNNPQAFRDAFVGSVIFRHEMNYFPLPGLSTLLVQSAEGSMERVRATLTQIARLERHSFQQGQANKALVQLAEKNTTALPCIHALLAEENLELLQVLAKKNGLAACYLGLLYSHDHQNEEKASHIVQLTQLLRLGLHAQKTEPPPKALQERLTWFLTHLEAFEAYAFCDELRVSLKVAHLWLQAKKISDLTAITYSKNGKLDQSAPPYFAAFATLNDALKEISRKLAVIREVERFETQQNMLYDVSEHTRRLVKQDTCVPFHEIWTQALQNGIEVIEKERASLQGTARLQLNLRNPRFIASQEPQKLHFTLENRGRALAENLRITALDFPFDQPTTEFAFLESGTTRPFELAVTAATPGPLRFQLQIRFNDADAANKSVTFPFEVSVEERAVAFVPIPNPYIAGNPLRGDSPLFYGRTDALAAIQNHFSHANDLGALVCFGLRRSGKSSLLKRMMQDGLAGMTPAFLDMQGVDDEADFYDSLARAIAKSLEQASPPAVESFRAFKRFLQDQTAGQRIVIFLDEFEELQLKVERGTFRKEVFGHLRHLMQHESQIGFLFCGAHRLDEMRSDYWSIFFNTASYLRLSYLSEAETRRLIAEPVAETLRYDGLAEDHLFHMTHGQPYLTQLLCKFVVARQNEVKSNIVSVNDVDAVIRHIIDQGQDQFSPWLWEQASQTERLLWATLADELAARNLDALAFDLLYQRVATIDAELDRAEVLKKLDRSVEREILSERDNRYGFQMGLFRQWVVTKQPLDKLRALFRE